MAAFPLGKSRHAYLIGAANLRMSASAFRGVRAATDGQHVTVSAATWPVRFLRLSAFY